MAKDGSIGVHVECDAAKCRCKHVMFGLHIGIAGIAIGGQDAVGSLIAKVLCIGKL